VPSLAGKALRGVLFDVDGTLLDTTYLHTISWWQAFRQLGIDVPMARIHRCIGMGADQMLAELLGPGQHEGIGSAVPEARRALYAQYWPALRPLPGAVELLRQCHSLGLRVGLASSADEAEMAVIRAALGAEDAIDAVTSSADAPTAKPAPGVLEAALDRLQLGAEEVVYVGDSVWDGLAAAALDIPFIGLTCGGTSEAELRNRGGAAEAYEDPSDLLAKWDHSVFASASARESSLSDRQLDPMAALL
jgi:HAD superfamily hydrolase (TIGR01509 family)